MVAATLLAAGLSFFLVPRAVSARANGADLVITVRAKTRVESLAGDRNLKINGAGGWCRLRIKGGRARVGAADCPRNLCVRQGWIDRPGQTIICLPHQIVLAVSTGGARSPGVDAVVR